MKALYQIKEGDFLRLKKENQKFIDVLDLTVIPLTKEYILTEQETCDLLGVTPRTLRTYRRKGYLGFIKIEGRILFLKHQLFRDLEELYYKSKKKED